MDIGIDVKYNTCFSFEAHVCNIRIDYGSDREQLHIDIMSIVIVQIKYYIL
jgi:hypothetical protein